MSITAAFQKSMFLGLLTTVLVGCGHGSFEGTYTGNVTAINPLLNIAQVAEGEPTEISLTIGENYIIGGDGNRINFDNIFVEDSGDRRFLVFQKEGKKDKTIDIIDDNTIYLKISNLGRAKLTRQ
ncbi:MAG: hypothetical protein ACTIM4_05110 [Marinomonas sp.]